MSNKIHVIFRACDAVNAFNNNPRPYDLSKKEIIKICFKSLYESIKEYPHSITVLGDKLSEEMLDFFRSYPVALTNGNYGNDESIRQSVRRALCLPDEEWVYFCEDDYLHTPDCFYHIQALIREREKIFYSKKNILFLYRKFRPEIAIHPPDYPDRYKNKPRDRGFLFHTSTCHWRQVVNTTFSFLMEVKNIRKFESVFMKASQGANDGYLSKNIYGRSSFRNKCLCLSPVPGLSNHMHRDTFTPLVDWEKIMKALTEKK
jgi:hypothetical protein